MNSARHRRRPGGVPAALALLLALGAALAARAGTPPVAADGDAVEVEIAGQTWKLARPRPLDPKSPERVQGSETLACARCHPTQTEEWSTTLHALAWQDPRYREALEGLRRPAKCHGCHAPEPVHLVGLGRRPKVRGTERALGVDCLGCHGGEDGMILGPRGAPSEAHPSRVDSSFTPEGRSRLCIQCHDTNVGPVIGVAKGFDTGGAPERGLSCVGCHMAPRERPAAVDPDSGAPGPARPGRSHALQTPRDPAFLAQAFALEARRVEGGLVLRIRNRAGHRLPGLEDRTFLFEVEELDAAGEVLARVTATIDKRTWLAAGAALEVPLGGRGAGLRVVARHAWAGASPPTPFLERELTPP